MWPLASILVAFIISQVQFQTPRIPVRERLSICESLVTVIHERTEARAGQAWLCSAARPWNVDPHAWHRNDAKATSSEQITCDDRTDTKLQWQLLGC